MRLLVFAGASEGRLLAERLASLPLDAVISVATGYGGEMLRDISHRFTVVEGRLDTDGMSALMADTRCGCVVDATHPYAAEASANIRAAAALAGVPRLRLLRPGSPAARCVHVDSVSAAAASLADTRGNALLTTGVKELAAYTGVPGYAERMFPRVLPSEESIRECVKLGFRRSHIIAMQGPFGRELNLAILRRFAIAVMTTKDGGAEGGFPEKMAAAEEAGVVVVVVGRPPEEDGLPLDGVMAAIEKLLEASA